MQLRLPIATFLLTTAILVSGKLLAQKPSIQNADSIRYSKMTGDDKANFWGTLGVVGNFIGESGNSFSFQPSLYNIRTWFNSKYEEAPYFRKERILRNTQLNLGLTPSQSTILTYDTAQLGFTYAFLNNKNLVKDDYDLLSNSPEFLTRNTIITILTNCLSDPAFSSSTGAIRSLIRKPTIAATDLDEIQDTVVYVVAAVLNIPRDKDFTAVSIKPKIIKAYNGAQEAFARELAALPKRSLITGSYNGIYDFIHGQWQEFDFTPFSWNVYLLKKIQQAKGRMAECPAINLSLTYIVSDDTAKKVFNLDREIYKASAGINFVISKGKQDQPFIEIKPAADYQYIQSGKYQKETYTTVKPSITLRIDISSSVSIPITIKYDKTHPKNDIFGFLSIQYSASKKGS